MRSGMPDSSKYGGSRRLATGGGGHVGPELGDGGASRANSYFGTCCKGVGGLSDDENWARV